MINKNIAHIKCQCGEEFQVMMVGEETALDWDEEATAIEYRKHLETCTESK